jgi:hypothetical protein
LGFLIKLAHKKHLKVLKASSIQRERSSSTKDNEGNKTKVMEKIISYKAITAPLPVASELQCF